MMISPAFVFTFSIFCAVSGVKGQKWPKMKDKNYIRHMSCLRNSKAYVHDF